MLHVGSRNDPTIRTRLVAIILVISIAIYLLGSISTGDWQWWQGNFATIPQAMRVHCYGSSVEIDPGSRHFIAINGIVNRSLSGWKRWDSSSFSRTSLEDYQADPDTVALELYYREALRIHTSSRYYSNVDTLVIPLEGRDAQTGTILGQNQDTPGESSALRIQSAAALASYLSKQGICPAALRTSR